MPEFYCASVFFETWKFWYMKKFLIVKIDSKGNVLNVSSSSFTVTKDTQKLSIVVLGLELGESKFLCFISSPI